MHRLTCQIFWMGHEVFKRGSQRHQYADARHCGLSRPSLESDA
jgi:hypothetical protein